jgi:hypothetical protein
MKWKHRNKEGGGMQRRIGARELERRITIGDDKVREVTTVDTLLAESMSGEETP